MRHYKGRTFVRETVHVCGEFLDADIYPVFQAPGKRRGRCRPTSDVQKRLNQRNAERKLTRLVHANFGEKDLALHLTYEDGRMPPDAESAKKELGKYLRKLRTEYRKRGIELKYITTTEVGKKTGRVHHHLILSGGVARDDLEQWWGRGYANSKRLQFGQTGCTGLAVYMAKESCKQTDGVKISFKRWNCSRNLAHPEPAQYDGRMSRADQAALAEAVENGTIYQLAEAQYPEYQLIEAEAIRNEINGGWYIRLNMRRKRGGNP